MLHQAEVIAPQRSALIMKIATQASEVEQALRLRYAVFVEEGRKIHLANPSGLERDEYDAFCDHLIIKDGLTDRVVGTYRLLPGRVASQQRGFYSATEFDLADLAARADQTLELGRSCVDAAYRASGVIQMLWSGIAAYMSLHSYRYLIGCASLSGLLLPELCELYTLLRRYGALTERFGARPLASHAIAGLREVEVEGSERDLLRRLPPLIKGYRLAGAEIAGAPAYDPLFDTTDFLMALQADRLIKKYQRHFLS